MGLKAYLRCPRQFGLVQQKVESRREILLFRLRASTSHHVFATPTLSRDDIAEVVERPAWVAVARLTPISPVRQPEIFGETLVAITSDHVSLACTLPGDDVATLIVYRAQRVARAGLATIRVVHREIPVAVLADVASPTFHVGLAVAAPGYKVVAEVGYRIANAAVEGTMRVTVASCNEKYWFVSIRDGRSC